MTKASDNAFPSLLITEGTEPSAPAAGKQRLYIDSTSHLLKATNSSGTDRTIEGGAASSLTSGRVVRVAGDVTTTSTTFADITGASITISTGARKVLLTFTCTAYSSSNAGTGGFDFNIDGTRASGADFGMSGFNQHATAGEAYPVAMSFLTDALTAASHTFKVQFRTGNAAHTLTVQAATASFAYVFTAVEVYA